MEPDFHVGDVRVTVEGERTVINASVLGGGECHHGEIRDSHLPCGCVIVNFLCDCGLGSEWVAKKGLCSVSGEHATWPSLPPLAKMDDRHNEFLQGLIAQYRRSTSVGTEVLAAMLSPEEIALLPAIMSHIQTVNGGAAEFTVVAKESVANPQHLPQISFNFVGVNLAGKIRHVVEIAHRADPKQFQGVGLRLATLIMLAFAKVGYEF